MIVYINGIDTESYDPACDKYIAQNFTAATLERRSPNKIALQEELGLEVNSGAFLIGMVTRLVEQKGIDLVIQILDRFMAYTDAQFILLGTGDRYYETQMWQKKNLFYIFDEQNVYIYIKIYFYVNNNGLYTTPNLLT